MIVSGLFRDPLLFASHARYPVLVLRFPMASLQKVFESLCCLDFLLLVGSCPLSPILFPSLCKQSPVAPSLADLLALGARQGAFRPHSPCNANYGSGFMMQAFGFGDADVVIIQYVGFVEFKGSTFGHDQAHIRDVFQHGPYRVLNANGFRVSVLGGWRSCSSKVSKDSFPAMSTQKP